MLDWNDLRSFLELARRGKLTMAGKRLNVEPTTVGRHINRLETELEVHLFDRSPKGYSLNDEGYKLLPYAENIETKIKFFVANTLFDIYVLGFLKEYIIPGWDAKCKTHSGLFTLNNKLSFFLFFKSIFLNLKFLFFFKILILCSLYFVE